MNRYTEQEGVAGEAGAVPGENGLLPQGRRRAALWTLFVGTFYSVCHVVSLNVSLPGFMDTFDTDLARVQWLVTGFTLATGIIAPLSGFIGDRYTNKKLFMPSVAGLTVSSVLCAIAWSIHALIAFRILQGLFCGLIQPVSLAMIYQILPKEEQARAANLWSLSTILGPALAPTVSGWLQGFNWSLILLLLFGNAHSWGWLSARSLVFASLGLGAIALFIRQELRH